MLESQKFQVVEHKRRRRNRRDGAPVTTDDHTAQPSTDIAQARAQLRARVDDEERLARVEALRAMVEEGRYTVDGQALAHTLSSQKSAMHNFLLSPSEETEQD
jgi:anti-sigma28 factor (negative regulator of flagellin synthesis)